MFSLGKKYGILMDGRLKVEGCYQTVHIFQYDRAFEIMLKIMEDGIYEEKEYEVVPLQATFTLQDKTYTLPIIDTDLDGGKNGFEPRKIIVDGTEKGLEQFPVLIYKCHISPISNRNSFKYCRESIGTEVGA